MGILETVRATMELVQQSDLGRRSLAEVDNATFEIIPDERQSIFLTITKGATEVGTQRPSIDHPDPAGLSSARAAPQRTIGA